MSDADYRPGGHPDRCDCEACQVYLSAGPFTQGLIRVSWELFGEWVTAVWIMGLVVFAVLVVAAILS